MKANEDPIGFLARHNKGHVVVCLECKFKSPYPCSVPIYHENIGCYQQHCKICNTLLHKPKTEAWPELFDGRL